MPEPTASLRKSSDRFFRRLLGLYPADFRAEWGGEMEELFAARRRREPIRRLLWEITLDTFKTAPKEHYAMLIQDLKYSLRALRNNPGFTAVAVLSLALGIGANSAIYSLANALLLRPLPVPDPGSLLIVQGQRTGDNGARGISHLDFLDLREQTKSFRALVASSDTLLAFAARPSETPQLKMANFVTANYFEELGVAPALGRGFRPDEDEAPGRNPVVVISYNMWVESFQSDPGILGRRLQLNGTELTIVGVAPKGFDGLRNLLRATLFVPIMMSPVLAPTASIHGSRSARSLSVRGRLRDGVSIEQANAEMATLTRNLEQAHPGTNQGRSARIRSELQQRVDDSPQDAILMGTLVFTTLLVLLIACVNVANLLLARGKSRTREIAVRLALGASRGRLLREMLTESLLLSIAGGTIGLLAAVGASAAFNTLSVPSDFPVKLDVHVDQQVLLYSLCISVASAFLFGLIPAWRSLRPDLVTGLKAGEFADSAGRQRLWGRGTLVTVQVTVSCVLLIAAAMMVAGMQSTLLREPGFRVENLLMAGMDTSSLADSSTFYERLIERTGKLPGVRSVALASCVPTANGSIRFARVTPEGFVLPAGQDGVSVYETLVSEHYFETAGIALRSGREFTLQDDRKAPRVAIVNELFATRFWPGQSAIGKRFGRGENMIEIVGVARDIKYIFFGEGPTPAIYVPFRQNGLGRMSLLAQTAADPNALAAPVRELIHELAPSVPLMNLRSMADYHQLRTVSIVNRLVDTVVTLGGVGLILALIGLYGTMSYSVTRRKREIGIRLAIGAAPGAILGLILRQGAWMAGTGIVIGTAIGFAASRGMEEGFLGMAVFHPAVFAAVPVLLSLAALAACWIPARRAALTEPTQALRCE